MSLREELNRKPRLAAGVVGGLMVVALLVFFWHRNDRGASVTMGPRGQYFTEDNGKTFFVAPPGSIPGETQGPDGATAYLARVWQLPGEQPKVGWVESFSPKGIASLKEFYSNPANRALPPDSANQDPEKIVRRPGENNWTRYGTEQYWQVVRLPERNGQSASMVEP